MASPSTIAGRGKHRMPTTTNAKPVASPSTEHNERRARSISDNDVAPLIGGKTGYKYDVTGRFCDLCRLRDDARVPATHVLYGTTDLGQPCKTYYCAADAATCEDGVPVRGNRESAVASTATAAPTRTCDKRTGPDECAVPKNQCMRCSRLFPWLHNEENEMCRTCDTMTDYVNETINTALLEYDRFGGVGKLRAMFDVEARERNSESSRDPMFGPPENYYDSEDECQFVKPYEF